MKPSITLRRVLASWQLVAAITLVGGSALAATKPHYVNINTVSDVPGLGFQTDPLLINPWGISTGVENNIRVADEGTGVATLYAPDGDLLDFSGTAAPLNHSISIPSTTGTSLPTGVADNQKALLETTDSNDFLITSGTVTKASHFIYCTEDGLIAGYNPAVSATSAILGANESGADAGYTGDTISWTGTSEKLAELNHKLFAANFAKEKVDVFDQTFTLTGTNTFVDPNLPAPPIVGGTTYSWSPFNVHTLDFKGRLSTSTEKEAIHHLIIVTYALHNKALTPLNDVPEISGTFYGYASVFTTDGTLVTPNPLGSIASQTGKLSSPWGVAVAHNPLPDLGAPIVVMIGSHGTGVIHAFAIDPRFPDLNKDLGTLKKDDAGDPLTIEGLWGLRFGDKKITIAEYTASDGQDLIEDTKDFYFTAGPLGEEHGLLGRIVHELAP
jgi:uncharacterized protein (TIGR03118 family)